jgi:hypothetical protein
VEKGESAVLSPMWQALSNHWPSISTSSLHFSYSFHRMNSGSRMYIWQRVLYSTCLYIRIFNCNFVNNELLNSSGRLHRVDGSIIPIF